MSEIISGFRFLPRQRLSSARPEEIVARLAGFPVISCDVFDTALQRDLARPGDVLLAVGARARAAGLIDCAPEAFRILREAAEGETRRAAHKAGHDEVRIDEIYAYLAACGAVSDAEAAAALEFAAERAVCRAVPEIRAALASRAPGQRLIFLSDSTLPGTWLATLLADNGYDGVYDVVSSADTRYNKHSGRLFAWLLEHLGCAARDILHLGDNPISDVARARAHGLATYHRPAAMLGPEKEAVAAQHTAVRLMHSRRRVRRDAAPSGMEKPLAHYASALMLGFALFALAEARRRGIRRLYFTARDGYLPLAIARRIVAKRGDPVELHYLEVSRGAIILPGLGEDPDTLAEMLSHTASGAPLANLLDPLGITADTTAQCLRELGLDPMAVNETARFGQDVARRLLVADPTLIASALAVRREAALGYLASEGFLAPGPRMIVDVGWRGSIQRHLARLTGLPRGDLYGCYLGLLPEALAPDLDMRTASGYLFTFGHPAPRCALAREGLLLFELFFSAPHGSVSHYRRIEDRFRPVHAEEEGRSGAARAAFFAALERDCLAEIDALDGLIDGAWPDSIDPDSVLFDFAPLLARPSRREVRAINAIPFVHGLDGRRLSVAVNPVPLHEFVRYPKATLQRLANAPWRAGAVRASLPWPIPDMTHRDFHHRATRLLRLFGGR